MKILFCLNKDIYCNLVLNYLLPYIADDDISLIFSHKVGKLKKTGILEKLNYLETKIEAQETIKEFWQKDFLNFCDLISKYKVKTIEIENINSDGFNKLSASKPDLIISIRFGQIFQQNIINIPKNGIINLHSGILPNYRGIMATFWTILDNKKKIGATLHYIDNKEIDKGRIIDMNYLEVNSKKSLIWHVASLYKEGSENILDFIDKVKSNKKIELKEIDKNEECNYFSYPKEEDLNRFAKNYKIFN